MRTTIRLQDELLTEAKKQALQNNMTLTAFIEYCLRQTIKKNKPGKELSLPTYGKGGLNNDVDLDNNQSLADLMEKN